MNETIATIYQAGACTRPWAEALTRVSNELGIRGCQMIGVSKASGAIIFSHASAHVAADIELAYIRTYHAVDPRVPVVLARQQGNWLYDQDEFAAETFSSNGYYNELLLAHAGRFSATSKIFENPEEVFAIGFVSGLSDLGFEPHHRQYIQSITYHLQQAAAMYQHTRQRVTQAFAGSELLQRMGHPAWLLDAQRGVSFANERAKTYLFEHNAFLLLRDRLVAQDRRTDEALDDAFRAIERDVAAGLTPRRRVVRFSAKSASAAINPAFHGSKGTGELSDPATRPMPFAAISLTAFVPSRSMFAFGTQLQVLLIVHSAAEPRTADTLLWEAAFDLTPAQSRVALEIFRGQSVQQIAAALQVARTTVKSHLAELFLKTGTKRQPELLLTLARLQMP